jgi:hypothetical protein
MEKNERLEKMKSAIRADLGSLQAFNDILIAYARENPDKLAEWIIKKQDMDFKLNKQKNEKKTNTATKVDS